MIGTFNIELPWWLILSILAFFLTPLILGILGIYYVISKKFSYITLGISAVIFFSFIIFFILNNPRNPLEQNLRIFGLPLSFFQEFTGNPSSLLGLAGIVLNYLAIFSLVNFTHRFLVKIVS